ncbi:hypothetical protein AMTR_s00029p00144380 [Amborella trichopoda]|uniref:Uncharacterized protein n=1 Tax=Amborella trichopoda TaxID=13333 RepID=W1PN94_AMBTC|nr:hypothetical protein AMTR_s00029p00144380 [Amborella trichopoda]
MRSILLGWRVKRLNLLHLPSLSPKLGEGLVRGRRALVVGINGCFICSSCELATAKTWPLHISPYEQLHNYFF